MTILITGASRGIGKAIAAKFASQGYDLLLSSRSEVALYKAMEEMQTRFPEVSVAAKAFDLSVPGEAQKLGAWVLGTNKIPDVVINNAGIFKPGSVHNEEEGFLEAQLQVNLLSAYHLTRSILPAMMERKSGHIFNMSSIAGIKAYANGGAYSISKYALNGFSSNLRQEMKPFGIKVTTVMPGAVHTDSWVGFDNKDNRIMHATDVAELVYSASQLSVAACVEEIIVRPQLGDL